MAEKQTNSDKLVDMLKFDPGKEPKVPQSAFEEIVADLTKERTEAAKAKAKEILFKAMDIRKKMTTTEREFNKTKAAAEKEMGKLLNQLKSALDGSTDAPEGGEEAQA
jgi:hypothetical protein